jgi:hypothetical protein
VVVRKCPIFHEMVVQKCPIFHEMVAQKCPKNIYLSSSKCLSGQACLLIPRSKPHFRH